jgi:hypothetical protein
MGVLGVIEVGPCFSVVAGHRWGSGGVKHRNSLPGPETGPTSDRLGVQAISDEQRKIMQNECTQLRSIERLRTIEYRRQPGNRYLGKLTFQQELLWLYVSTIRRPWKIATANSARKSSPIKRPSDTS